MVSCSPTPVPRVGGVRVWGCEGMGVGVGVWGCGGVGVWVWGSGGRGVLPYGVVGPAVE